jgi:hypothetical protein
MAVSESRQPIEAFSLNRPWRIGFAAIAALSNCALRNPKTRPRSAAHASNL